jgi:glutamate-1-semialdehyde 2,1-aminomutase
MNTYRYPKSRELFARAAKVIPGGVYGHLGPVESCFIPVEAFPMFGDRAEGAHFWDVDGNRFIDYMCAYGPNILGYNDPEVDAAALAALKKGNCTTSPPSLLIDFAEEMVDTVAMADWAFFAKNGGDATSFALMIARAATGRDKAILVKGGYHGVAPWTQKKGQPGITNADVSNNLYVDWNDIAAVERLVSEHRGQIAVFMATPYSHPVFTDSELPKPGYWAAIRKICDDNGIVLAIDDVRCGFRLDMAGSDHYFGFKADLMCFCKAIANGYNVSAVCGIDALKDAASSIMYTGSYWLSAMPLAAGLACVRKMRRIDAARVTQSIGKELTEGLVVAGKAHGFDLRVSGVPSMWYMRIADDDSLLLHQEWVAECVMRGVYFTNHHNLFINTAISKEDIALSLEVADEAFAIVRGRHPKA